MPPIGPTPSILTYIDTDGALVRVWGICDKDSHDQVQVMIDVFARKLVDGVGMVRSVSELIPGKIVLANYISESHKFHRAEIIQVDPVARKVLVRFVDLGIKTSIDVQDIRLADGIFNTVPRSLAEECILRGVTVKRMWSPNDIESVQTCLNHTSEIILSGYIGHKKLLQVVLNINGNVISLSNFLVTTHLADPISDDQLLALIQDNRDNQTPLNQFHVPPPALPNIPPPFSLPQQTNLRVTAPVFQIDAQQSNMQTYQRFRMPRPPETVQHQPLILKFTYLTLPVGSTHEVCVSHVIDGMSAFTVQLKEVVDLKLPRLMARMNDIKPEPFTDPIGPGTLCLGRYTEDNSLCRAVVSTVLAEAATLYFVDFGNSEIVPFNHIFKIPTEFLQEPTMAMRFGLADLSSNYSLSTSEANAIFADLVLQVENIFLLKVTKSETAAKQNCELFLNLNGKHINIKNIILDKVKLMKPVEYKKINMKKNQACDVVISFAESPMRFFAQLEMNQPILDLVMKGVQDYCQSAENKDLLYAEDVNENIAVCALYEDGKWYRGLIIDEPDNEGNVAIFYVDFGNQDNVHFSKLRIMNNEMMSQFPMQALECRLDYDQSIILNDDVNSWFIDMSDGKTFRMIVKNILPGNVLLVDLIDFGELNIGEELNKQFVQKPVSPAVSPSKSNAPGGQKPQGWREKNTPNDGDFSSFHGRDDNRSSRPEYEDKRKNYDRRRDAEGVDTTDDGWNKNGGDFWIKGAKPSDSGEWRNQDRFNKRPPRGDFNGPAREDRRSYRRRDDEYGDSKEVRTRRGSQEDGRPVRRGSQDDNWQSNVAERRFERGNRGFDRKSDDDSWPKRNDDGFKNRRDEFNDNRASRNDKRNDKSDNARGGESSWGAQNSDHDRAGGFADGRRDGFRKKDEGLSPNQDRGARRRDDGFTPRSTFTLLEGFEKGAQLVDPNYEIGAQMDVVVTWFVNPVCFYVMPSENDDFRRLMEEIQNEYPKRRYLNVNDLSSNDCVIARYKDNVIYRATVLRTSPRGVVVKFVDYGNTETVGKQVWAISADHCVIPKQAICCSLYNIASADENGVWNETMEYDKYFGKDSFKLTIIQCVEENNTKTWMVNLTDADGQDIAEQLVKDNLAIRKIVLNSEDLYDVNLLLHQTVPVFLGVAISARKFFVHIEPHKAHIIKTCIETLMENEKNLVPVPNDGIIAGQFCLAPSTDEAYYRALIMDANETERQAHVLFIDYGDEYDVPFDKIMTLPDELKIYNAQVIECCLFESENFTNDEDFVAAIEEKDFVIKVMDVKDNVLHVKVFDINGACLPYPQESDETVPVICPATILKRVESVLISYLISDKVYLQRISDQILLNDFNTKMNEKYDSETDAEKVAIECGKFYAAKSALFDAWYRCQLSEAESDQVFYIDYGNTEAIESLLAVRPLHEEFYNVPAFCVAAKVSADVKDDANEALLGVVQDYVFEATYKNIGPNDWFVELVTESGKSYGDIVAETDNGTKRDTELVQGYDAFDNWRLFEEKNVIITCIESPIRFNLMFDEDAAKLDKVAEQLEDDLKLVLPMVGKCKGIRAAKSKNGKWYRTDENDYAVDYGCQIEATEYKKLPARYCAEGDKYYVECGLNVSSPELEWHAGTVEKFREFVKGDNVMAKLEDRRGKIVELMVDERNIAEQLVTEGLAKYREHVVSVSHANSLDDFYVQHKDAKDELYDLLEKLKEAENWSTVEVPKVGQILAARFTEDEEWYRAEVIEVNDEVKVKFIDYGNESVCQELRELPRELANIGKYAVQCCLHPLPVNADLLADKFKRFVSSHENFVVYFLSRIEPMLVMMYYAGDAIEELIKDISMPVFDVVSVSHINSPSSFYVQSVDARLLDEVTKELKNVEQLEATTAENGVLYAAKYNEDGLWYRAKAIEDEMLFIDYGNTSKSTEVRNLTENLTVIPALAKHCAIPTPPGLRSWPEVATQRFAELTCDGNTIFEMNILQDGDPAVVLLKYEGIDVLEELNTLCQAEMTVKVRDDKPTVMLSHVVGVNDLWIQEQKPSLDELCDELANVDGFDVLETAQVEDIVAALYEDGVWYRAKILERLESRYRVVFIDYGNESTVEQIKSLPEDLAKMPAFAVRCRLAGLPQEAGEWPETVLDKLLDISENVGTFVLEKEDDGVTLRYDGCDLAEELIKFKDSIGNGNTESAQVEDVANDGETIDEAIEKSNDATVESDDEVLHENGTGSVSNEPSIVEKSRQLMKDDEIVAELECSIAEQTATGGLAKYRVSHVNSLNDFYVQDKELDDELYDLLENLKQAENWSIVEVPEPGQMVVAKLTEDQQWYRAEVIEVNDGVKVKFIDYGDTSISKDVRNMADNLTAIPALAKRCAMPTPAGLRSWPEVATQRFAELTCNGDAIFEMNILQDGDPAVVLLKYEGIDLLEELNTLCQAEMTVTVEDGKSTVVLSLVESLNAIWVQELNPSFRELKKKLANVEAFGVAETAHVGDIVVVDMFGDDVWYRAKILQKLESGFRVLLIDYGHELNVDEIKSLPQDLAEMPAFAVRCRLAGLPQEAGKWPETVLDKLLNISENIGTFVLEKKEDDRVTLKYDGCDLAEELIKLEDDKVENAIANEQIAGQDRRNIFKNLSFRIIQESNDATVQSNDEVLHEIDAESSPNEPSTDQTDATVNKLDEVIQESNDATVQSNDQVLHEIEAESSPNEPSADQTDATVDKLGEEIHERNDEAFYDRSNAGSLEEVSQEQGIRIESSPERSNSNVVVDKLDTDSMELSVEASKFVPIRDVLNGDLEKVDDTFDLVSNDVETKSSICCEPDGDQFEVPRCENDLEKVPDMVATEKEFISGVDSENEQAEVEGIDETVVVNKPSKGLEVETNDNDGVQLDSENGTEEVSKTDVIGVEASEGEKRVESEIINLDGNVEESLDVEIAADRAVEIFDERIPHIESDGGKELPNEPAVVSELETEVCDETQLINSEMVTKEASRIDMINTEANDDEAKGVDNLNEPNADTNVNLRSVDEELRRESIENANQEAPVTKTPKLDSNLSPDPYSYRVTHVENPGSFYVQKTIDSRKLSSLEKTLKNVEETSQPLENVEIGSTVGAKIENLSVRAKVVDKDEFSGYIIFCIDYGTESKSKKLFELPDDLKGLKPLVKRCGLPLPAHLHHWPTDVCKKFELVTQFDNPTFKLTFMEETDEISYVNLTREEVDVWKNINEFCQEFEGED